MPCFRPYTAWQPLDGGKLVFSEQRDCREIGIPCGQCIGCRRMRQEDWVIRIMGEAKFHETSLFVTLTYDDEHLPADGGLHYSQVQDWLQRLRRVIGPFRYFCVGEYGDKTARPHWHVILFGPRLKDLERPSFKSKFLRSATLEKSWPSGFVSIGTVSPESARYVAKYAVKRANGDQAIIRYTRVDVCTGKSWMVAPEKARMSLKPGVGERWIRQYWREVARDGAVVGRGGRKSRVPAFFRRWLSENLSDKAVAELESETQARAAAFLAATAKDRTRDRLAVREALANAKVKFDGERKRHGKI